MSESSTPGRERDPREGPKPPFPEQEQQAPGSDAGLRPQADHGEQSYRGCGRLEGLAAIVTGGDSGIGRAVAIAFAREGADVLISYLDEHDDARTTAALVESAGRRAIAVAGDISELAHCGRIVDRAVSEFGRLDVVVNNAATQSLHASFPTSRTLRSSGSSAPMSFPSSRSAARPSRISGPAERSSTPSRSRPSTPRPLCCTTPPARARS